MNSNKSNITKGELDSRLTALTNTFKTMMLDAYCKVGKSVITVDNENPSVRYGGTFSGPTTITVINSSCDLTATSSGEEGLFRLYDRKSKCLRTMTAKAVSSSVIYGACNLLEGDVYGDTVDHYFSYGSGIKIDSTNGTKLYKWTRTA